MSMRTVKYRFNGDWRFFILENKEIPSEIKTRIMEQAQKIAEKQGMSFDQAAWYKTPHIIGRIRRKN